MMNRYVCFLALIAAVPAHGQPLPDGAGKQAVEAYCGACHDASTITRRESQGVRSVIGTNRAQLPGVGLNRIFKM
jgi:hypothetical protein